MSAETIKSIIDDAPLFHGNGVELLRGDQVVMQVVDWLWPGWLARGKLHMLAGAPGTGKTTIAMALAAALTRGSKWPDGTAAAIADVMIWSGEDDPADTLAPRLKAMGADMTRIHFIKSTRDSNGERPFDPAADMGALEDKIQAIRPALLIIDPIVSAVAGDSHKNTETRRALQPFVNLSAKFGMALLGISHFSKGTAGRNPTERVTGSLAFGALPRVVMVAAKIEGGENGKRIFCRAKSNIGPDDDGFHYDLEQKVVPFHDGLSASCVAWGSPVEGSATELLAAAETPEVNDNSLSAAKEFLEVELKDGPVSVQKIKETSKQAGHAWRTLRRAKDALGIKTLKGGMKEGWFWKLPSKSSNEAEDVQTNDMDAFENNGPLLLTHQPGDPAE